MEEADVMSGNGGSVQSSHLYLTLQSSHLYSDSKSDVNGVDGNRSGACRRVGWIGYRFRQRKCKMGFVLSVREIAMLMKTLFGDLGGDCQHDFDYLAGR